jgi:hypothetical protein
MTDSDIAAATLDTVPENADECFARGIFYSSGRCAPLDMVAAHMWLNIAASRGHKEAAQMRREIAEQMSDAEIGMAQRTARDWLKSNPLPASVEQVLRTAA